MKYIGLIKTDDLPSTSIGLRVSEMAKLGFSPIILYAKTRTTVAKQFRRGIVVSNEQKLKEEIARQGDCLVIIAAKHSVDSNGIKALGEPKEMECRCLTGQRFVGCTSEGERSVVKVFEYDRRRGVSRFDRGDSGDVRIDMPNNKGLMIMRSSDFLKMLAHGDSFISAGDDFRETADAVGVFVICVDPINAGVSWHAGRIHDEKKPVNVVYGEKRPMIREQVRNEIQEDVKKEEPAILKPETFPTSIVENDKKDVETNRAETYNESEERRDNDLPVLSIVFQTHNRTATACFCLDALCKKLKYSGKIHYCICDDRSVDGHVSALVSVLMENGIKDYSVHLTNDERWGLGASMNNGLEWSFKFTDTVMTAEDDFLLKQDFDITPLVVELMKPDVACIKLAAVSNRLTHSVPCGHPGFKKVEANMKIPAEVRYVMNNLVALRHKRFFDTVGLYLDNVHPETMETAMSLKFNKRFNYGRSNEQKILAPDFLQPGTFDTKYFKHIGVSTIGHSLGRPKDSKYRYLYEENADTNEIVRRVQSMSAKINIVVASYNQPDLLERCLKSVDAQKDAPKFFVTVVDDKSYDEYCRGINDVVAKRDYAMLMPQHDKKMAGGAWNKGTFNSPVKAEYTMFLDSDDELLYDHALSDVCKKLDEDRPDMLLIGYRFNGGDKLPSDDPNERWASAPWSRICRTDKMQRFMEGRRVCNDTIQAINTFDTITNRKSLRKAIIKYNTDSNFSGWHSKTVRTQRAAVTSVVTTLLDIFETKPVNKAGKDVARQHLSYLTKVLNNQLAILSKKWTESL